MPYNLNIIRHSDFVRMDAEGKVDMKKTQDALAHLAKSCIDRGIECALLDVRGVNSELTVNELYLLAKMFPATGFSTRHRLAILHKYNSGQRAELFAMFASDRGWNVDAFDNYEDATDWFSTALPLDEA